MLATLSLTLAAVAVGCAAGEDLSPPNGGGAAGRGGSSMASGASGASGSAAAAGSSGDAGAAGSGGRSGSAPNAADSGSGGDRADSGAEGDRALGDAGDRRGAGADASVVPSDAGAAAGSLFFDGFDDGNLTTPSWIDADPELGGMWSVRADQSNQVLSQSASAAASSWIIAVSGDYRWTDQVVQVKVRLTSAPGMAGIFARLQDAKSYYFLYVDDTNIILRKRISSGSSSSSTNVQKVKLTAPITMGTWHVLKLAVVGATMTGYLDGAMLVSGPASEIPSGGIGVGTSGATADFDDVSVTLP